MPGSFDQALAELASSQFGLFTRSQATMFGVSRAAIRSRVETGSWLVLFPGVFAIAGSPPSTERALLAACLLGGEGTMVTRRAAAWLWDLPGSRGPSVEVLSPRWRRVQAHGMRAHESKKIDEPDCSARSGIPVTSACRTIIDCCAVVHPHRAGEMLDDARRRGLLTLGAFARRVDDLAASGRNGIRVARGLVTDRGAPPASVFETRLARVLRDAGLPEPVCEHQLTVGGQHYRLDFAYPDRRLCIEADSEAFHLDLAAFRRDRQRQNALVLAGWTILRFTWLDVHDHPERVVSQVRAALAAASA